MCAAPDRGLDLGPPDLARLLDRFDLGDGATIAPAADRGQQGSVWKLTSSRGAFAVKTMFETWTEDEVAEPAEFQQLVHAAGVAVPGVVRTVDGGVLADVDGRTVRVYDWVDLRAPNPLLDPSAVGAVVAAIHRVRWVESTSVHPWYTEPVGAARWTELCDAAVRERAPFADDLTAMVEGMIALESLLEPAADIQTCHCDLWADNVRSTPAGEVCVIDWENAGPADPSQELCLPLYDFGSDATRARALYGAYREDGGPARIERPGQFSMLIAQLGHINERAISRWLRDGATIEQRAHDAALFGEFVSRPLTLALIDEILGAIA
ncbi:MAG: aminoglycoside phosphotransferase [Ilumatobacteraceae bacterium]|nr:aminoglycoside phosphotransferase [Ilumatobacteraceae bacterium]MCU1390340.1 aminoglycoside phosphotransferase [Ilumatobacteraceae bacterium]